jgi:hypothetical protein
MTNQEQQNQEKTTEEAALEKRRRFIKGAGIAAPVVLSLANRTAFGQAQQCLSQQQSGNMSSNGVGSCELGSSPDSWKTRIVEDPKLASGPTETITINKNVITKSLGGGTNGIGIQIRQKKIETKKTYKFTGTELIYGVLVKTDFVTEIYQINNGNGKVSTTAETAKITVFNASPSPAISSSPPATNTDLNGVVIKDASFQTGTKSEYTGANPPNSAILPTTLPNAIWSDFTEGITYDAIFGQGSTLFLRTILNTLNSPDAPCVAAYLNALTVTKYAGGTPLEVRAMCNHSADYSDRVPPGYLTLEAFYATTWTK